MKKVLRLFKRSSGFTLVEMIISVALLAILLGGMMMFLSPVIKSFNDQSKSLVAENAATCIQEYVSKSIRNANQIAIFQNTNYSSMMSSPVCADKIKSMNAFCSGVNGTSPNKTYLLKCISIKYDATAQGYYLWNETVDMADSNAALKPSEAKKVFADCFYNDLYYTFGFERMLNGDYSKGIAGAPQYRSDALNISINAYSNAPCTNPVFYGSGVTELRQIKVMLAAGGSSSDFNLTLVPEVPVTDFSSMTEGSRDIYIYYVSRQFTTTGP